MSYYPQPTPVYINVEPQENVLGTVGFVAALLSLFTCGLIAPIAFLMCFIAVFFPPRGLAIAGLIISSVFSLWFWLFGLAMVLTIIGAGTAVQEASAKAAAEVRKEQEAIKKLQMQGRPSVTKPTSLPTAPGKATLTSTPKLFEEPDVPMPAPVPGDLSARVGQVAASGEVRVGVASVEVGTVKLKDFAGRSVEGDDPQLQIVVTIENVSRTTKIDYLGWGGNVPYNRHPATLSDERGNVYKRVSYGINRVVGQAGAPQSIYPGKSHNDRLVFELPVDGAEFLVLRLPGIALGLDDDLELVLSPPTIEKPTAAIPPESKEPMAKPAAAPASTWREWTSTSGTKIEARFRGQIGATVKLEKRDGSVINVDEALLSPADRAYIRAKR